MRLIFFLSLTSRACITALSQQSELRPYCLTLRSQRKSTPCTCDHRNTLSRMISAPSLDHIITTFRERQVNSSFTFSRFSSCSYSTSAFQEWYSWSVTLVSPTKMLASSLARAKKAGRSSRSLSTSTMRVYSSAWWAPTRVCRQTSPSRMYLNLDLNMLLSCSSVKRAVALRAYRAAATQTCRVRSLNWSFSRFLLAMPGWCSKQPSRKKCCSSKTLSLDLERISLAGTDYFGLVIRCTGIPPANTQIYGRQQRNLRGYRYHDISCSMATRQVYLWPAWNSSDQRSQQRRSGIDMFQSRFTFWQIGHRQPQLFSQWVFYTRGSKGKDIFYFIRQLEHIITIPVEPSILAQSSQVRQISIIIHKKVVSTKSVLLLGGALDNRPLHLGQRLPGLYILDGLGPEVLRRNLEQPRGLDLHHRPHIVLLGQHQLVVSHILRPVRQHRTGVDHHHLRILDRQIHVVLLQNRHLRKVTRKNTLLHYRTIHLQRHLVLHKHVQLLDDGLELVADVEGRLEVAVVQEVLETPVHVLVLAFVLEEGVHEGEVVAVLRDKLGVGCIRLAHLVLGPQEDVGRVETGNDGEYLVDASVLGRGQQHLAQLRLQRELRHPLALLRQVALVVQRPQIVQQLQRPHHGLGGRRVHKVEVHQVVHPQLLQRQHRRRQVRPQDLRIRVLYQLLVVRLLSVQTETLPRLGTTRPTRPLLSTRLGNGRHQQTLDSHSRVEHLLLGEPRVDHVDDTVDGDTGLGDVGSDDDLAALEPLLAGLGRVLEYPLLLVGRQCGVERYHRHRPHLVPQPPHLLLYLAACSLDLLLPRQEQQDVPLPLVLVDRHRSPDRRLHVVRLRLLAEVDVHRKHTPGNVQPRRTLEVLLELNRVHSRRHHDQLEVAAADQDLLYQTEQHVRVQRTLVRLVQNYHRVTVQVAVRHRLTQQHTVSHVLQDRTLRCQVLETDRVTHLLTQLHIQLLTNPLGHRHGRHPPGLRAGNALALAGISRLDQKLRNLRGLAGPRLPHQHNHLVLRHQIQQLMPGLVSRQLSPGLQQFEVVLGVGAAGEEVDVGFDLLGTSLDLLGALHNDTSAHGVEAVGGMHYQQVIEKLLSGQTIPESTLRDLCSKLIETLAQQSNLLTLSAPVNVVGDVHGQFFDLVKLLSIDGPPPHRKYLFLGDYVDRGYHSLETFLLLATYKLLHPAHIYLLRGNHESRQISSMYGFYEQTQKKYGSTNVWKIFNQVFDYLPLAATINSELFCLHGGLSPEIHTLEQINDIDRLTEIPTSGGFGDLVWSDPEEIEGWSPGSRGVGWLFGSRVANEFNQLNGLRLIVRSHQLVEKGHQWWFKSQNLITIWSAPNYCYRCGNSACIMRVDEAGTVSFQTFWEDPRSIQSVHYGKLIPYFL